ncbi:glycosyltransferase family 4 protein [Spirosoma fluminis]
MIADRPSTLTRCVTAHVGARDHYQLSLALHEAGLLAQLVTEAYAPNWLRHAAPRQARRRYCSGLPSSVVSLSAEALGLTAFARLTSQNYTHRIDQVISQRAYQEAVETQANLFLYSYYAHWAFQQALLDNYPGQRLLFQLHPHPYSVRQLLEDEMERVPFAAQSIRDEAEFQLPPSALESLALEASLASHCITASQFTKATLEENGILAARIQVVPYGVDADKFPVRVRPPGSAVFRIIFVGRMNQRKGLADLLEAVRLLRHKPLEVVLCGRGYVDHAILREYRELPVRVLLDLSADQLLRELHQSHVFVLPSLAEGFGHVILEAMAAGLPVITTANTGAPDILQHHRHGAIVPIRDPYRICEQLEAAIRRPDDWFQMGQQAARQARQFSWSRFRTAIAEAYQEATTTSPTVQ